jgi:hypothetical protein
MQAFLVILARELRAEISDWFPIDVTIRAGWSALPGRSSYLGRSRLRVDLGVDEAPFQIEVRGFVDLPFALRLQEAP